jgi:predicted nucleic acid-binding protein
VPLLNVRLSPDDARRAAELREEGVQISDVVREAIRAEYLRRRPGGPGNRRPSLKRGIVLCEPVLTEACFLLNHPVQRARLQRLVIEIGMSPPAIEDEKELRGEVFGWLARYSEHEPDWADGYLAVVSERQKGARVWTYDREFRTTWRRSDGTRIPLAVR